LGGATSSAIEPEGGGVHSRRPEAAECAGEEDKVEGRKRKGKKKSK
jgi:hypothetical protein